LRRESPVLGKDWNDQLLGKEQERNERMAIAQDLWRWYDAASAEERVAVIQAGLEFNAARQARDLTQEESAAIQRVKDGVSEKFDAIGSTTSFLPEFHTHKPITVQDVREWYRKARDLGRSDRHLKCIEQAGKAFILGQELGERDRQMMLKDTMLWEEQALTVAVQARYILSSVGEALETGKVFSSETYLLYGKEDCLYALAQGRGTNLSEKDQQILPQSVIEAGWKIVLKIQQGEVSADTRLTSADGYRFKQFVEQIQQRKDS
jgi:hypothetical protein